MLDNWYLSITLRYCQVSLKIGIDQLVPEVLHLSLVSSQLFPLNFTLPETMEHVNTQLQPMNMHSGSIHMQLMQWFHETGNLGL